MPHPEQIVSELRRQLGTSGTTFFLVYSFNDVLSDEQRTKITSNSNAQGISAIMSYILRPTEEAVNILAVALATAAHAGLAVLSGERNAASPPLEPEHVEPWVVHARGLLELLRARWVVTGWEKDPAQPS